MKEHKIIILTGPGGVGKSTISQYLCEHYPNEFRESVSCTTRSIRPNETNHVHYHFISEQEFAEKIKNDEFLEYNLFPNGRMYGTLYSEIYDTLKTKNCIMVIDPLSAVKLKEKLDGQNVITIFLDVDDDQLLSRLKKRGDDEDAIFQRILIAHEERNLKGKCDISLVADGDVEKVAQAIYALVER